MEALHGMLKELAARLSGPNYQEHAVGESRQYVAVRHRQDRRGIEHDESIALAHLRQDLVHSLGSQRLDGIVGETPPAQHHMKGPNRREAVFYGESWLHQQIVEAGARPDIEVVMNARFAQIRVDQENLSLEGGGQRQGKVDRRQGLALSPGRAGYREDPPVLVAELRADLHGEDVVLVRRDRGRRLGRERMLSGAIGDRSD